MESSSFPQLMNDIVSLKFTHWIDVTVPMLTAADDERAREEGQSTWE